MHWDGSTVSLRLIGPHESIVRPHSFGFVQLGHKGFNETEGQEFVEHGDEKGRRGKENALGEVLGGHLVVSVFKKGTDPACAGKVLECGESNENHKENPVGQETTKRIQLVWKDFTAADHVEKLKPDKSVPNKRDVFLFVFAHLRVVSGLNSLVIADSEDHVRSEHHNHHHGKLVKSNAKDLSVDVRRHNSFLIDLRFGDVSSRFHACKSKSSENVHNEVDPNELHRIDRRFSHKDVANEHSEQTGQIDGDLELQEALNVLVHVASPHNSTHQRLKIVIGQNHGRSIASQRSARTHSERRICRIKRSNVGNSFANNCNLLALASQTGNNELFVFGDGAG